MPPREIWDATTLDLHDERRLLDGRWEHVAWDRLDEAPHFGGARMVTVPGGAGPGAFRTTFHVSSQPNKKRVILHFGAVGYRSRVFVNGESVAYYLGGYTPFEVDVTGQVRQGDNELVVLVLGVRGTQLHPDVDAIDPGRDEFTLSGQALARHTTQSVISFGFFAFEGIRQSVHVRESPLVRVADTTLVTSYRDKRLDATVAVMNQTDDDQSMMVRLDVLPYDIDTRGIGESAAWTAEKEVSIERGLHNVEIGDAWSDARLWMPGDPHLYVARVRLIDAADEQVLHERHVRFGFREVWTQGRSIMINGLPFRGFTKGMLDPYGSTDRLRQRFERMREDFGINTVRPSSMPPPPSFVQLADEMGMAIIGESELTFNRNHAYDEPAFWSNFRRLWEDRIARDKNHPSIIIWSQANEVMLTSPGARIGERFYNNYLHLRQVDPTRPIMQEGDGDLRDNTPEGRGFPIDIINVHLYDVSLTKNPLWATEFPPVAWAMENMTKPSEMPGALKYGVGMIDWNRPWYNGEFGPGVSISYPDHFAFWSGPAAYRNLFGHAEELVRGIGETVAIQLHGFRDLDFAGMDPWDLVNKPAMSPYLKPAMSPLIVFTRDMRSHWTSGTQIERSTVTLNDSFETQELVVEAKLTRGGDTVFFREQRVTLAPGERADMTWQLQIPVVSARTPCRYEVTLRNADGQRVSGFSQDWRVYPKIHPAGMWTKGKVWLVGEAADLGSIAEWAGVTRRSPAALQELHVHAVSVVVIAGPVVHMLSPEARSAVSAYVESGGVVLTLNADVVNLAGLELSANFLSDSTRVFLQQSHPLTAGTTEDEWQFWHPDHYVSRANFPTSLDPAFDLPLVASGAGGLRFSPLVVARHGSGALIASRLQLNEAMTTEPVARIFLNNLVDYAQALTEEAASRVPARELVVFAPDADRQAWEARMNAARIPIHAGGPRSLNARRHVVFVSGDADLSAVELDVIQRFVATGGTLWLNELTADTPYLPRVTRWLGHEPRFREPAMWLQQFELASWPNDHPLLDGVNDYHTCWATFAWTHGDIHSIRMTKIADNVLESVGGRGQALLVEPAWIGEWDITIDHGTLSQKLLTNLGKHQRNDSPGVALAVYAVGRGQVIVDQLRWNDVILDGSSGSQFKARHIAGTLWKNMSR
jgi:hypothetical protein